MIKARIVFVLGAGASSCYGFPLGQSLCRLVTEQFREGAGEGADFHVQFLKNTKFSKEQLEEFRKELQYSGQNSIDAFLENRHEFLEIGKAAMSFVLIRYEARDVLWNFSSNNWMRYLFDKMRAPTLGEFSDNRVTFITFNFDRSLDQFLFESLRRTFGACEDKVWEVLSRIPLIHLHGRLGYLPWQHATLVRPYDVDINAGAIEMCVREIKLVHEELKNGRDNDFTEAKRLLSQADRIYFLGFGFGEINVSRLELRNLVQGRAVATAFGFTTHEVESLNKMCEQKISIYPHHTIESLFHDAVIWE